MSLVSSSAPSVSSFHGYSVGAAMPGKSVVINGFLCMPDVSRASCTHRLRTATGAHRIQFLAEEGVPALVCHSRGSGTWSWMPQTLPRVQLPGLRSGRLCGRDETGQPSCTPQKLVFYVVGAGFVLPQKAACGKHRVGISKGS